jgi:hypothetical protein
MSGENKGAKRKQTENAARTFQVKGVVVVVEEAHQRHAVAQDRVLQDVVKVCLLVAHTH